MRHLASEQIQEFLDHGLTPREEAVVQAHLSVCPHCREELETWGLLFSDLDSLEALAPGPTFAQEILSQLPQEKTLAGKIRGWVARPEGPEPSSVHLPPERIQDYLDGALPGRQGNQARDHLAACQPCQAEVQGWRNLFGALNGLAHLAPAPGFAQRVMARVRIPAPVPTPMAEAGSRLLGWARGFLPRTRKGWAVAGGIASAPTITMATLFYLVFSHPLLGLGTFTTYVSWKASALLTTLFSAVGDAMVGSVALFRAYSVLGALADSPLLVGAGSLTFSLLSVLALWVLYRNLVATRTPEGRYARARV